MQIKRKGKYYWQKKNDELKICTFGKGEEFLKRYVMWRTSVLSPLSFRSLALDQRLISSTHLSTYGISKVRSDSSSRTINTWLLSAQIIRQRPCVWIIFSNGAVYIVTHNGPMTDPWGIPSRGVCSIDNVPLTAKCRSSDAISVGKSSKEHIMVDGIKSSWIKDN